MFITLSIEGYKKYRKSLIAPAISKKPLKRLEEAVGKTSSTGLKSGVNERIHPAKTGFHAEDYTGAPL